MISLHSPGRVLLTGATGFVGPHVADAFTAAGYAVRALVRSRTRARRIAAADVDIVIGDLQDEGALEAACHDVGTVVHMAALTHARRRADYDAVNEEGTRRLISAVTAARNGPGRLIYLSSLAAAGPATGGRPVVPEAEPKPLTDYGRSKLAGELVCRSVADELRVVILRPPAVYGPGDTDLFNFFRIASRGVIPVPTGPDRLLQMIHATDLARAVVHAARAPDARGVYHVAEDRAYAWIDVGRMVARAVGRPSARVVRVPAPLISGLAAVSEAGAAAVGRSTIFNRDKAREMLAAGWLCDTGSARSDLDFETRIPLEQGLHSTAQWYRDEGWL